MVHLSLEINKQTGINLINIPLFTLFVVQETKEFRLKQFCDKASKQQTTSLAMESCNNKTKQNKNKTETLDSPPFFTFPSIRKSI
jgi:hypothetical protein